ncbi:MAG: hypothetical protein JNN27_18310 [Planctomycetes bacterium]|nr:hypothetical protein [Planctomycetota bacterium]
MWPKTRTRACNAPRGSRAWACATKPPPGSPAHQFGPKDGFCSFQTACVHAVLGNPTDALEALSTAQVRSYFIRSEQRSSEFDFLRGLPEFDKLIK